MMLPIAITITEFETEIMMPEMALDVQVGDKEVCHDSPEAPAELKPVVETPLPPKKTLDREETFNSKLQGKTEDVENEDTDIVSY